MKIRNFKRGLTPIFFFIGVVAIAWTNANATTTMCGGSSVTLTTGTVTSTIYTSDVDFVNYAPPPDSVNATDCFITDANTTNAASEISIINATNWVTTSTYGSGSFAYGDKSDDPSATVAGVEWTISYTPDSGDSKPETGDWTLAWNDVGSPDPTLSEYFDIVVFFKGGSLHSAGYLFDDLYIPDSPTSGTGSYTINFKNNGGQFTNLSHATLGVRAGTDPNPNPAPVLPVPAPLALFGLGGLILGWSMKRSKSRA